MSKLDPVGPVTETRDPDIFTMYADDPYLDPSDPLRDVPLADESAQKADVWSEAVRARYMSNVSMWAARSPTMVRVVYTHGNSPELKYRAMTLDSARRLAKGFGIPFDRIEAQFMKYANETKVRQ